MLARAIELAQAGRFDDAHAILAPLCESQQAEPATLSYYGWLLTQLRRPAEAVPIFRRSLQRSPGNTDLYVNLGIALLECGDSRGAVAELRTAVQHSPKDADALRHLGIALLQLGEIREAITSLQAALRLRPSDASTRIQLARAHLEVGEVEPARLLIAKLDPAMLSDQDTMEGAELLQAVFLPDTAERWLNAAAGRPTKDPRVTLRLAAFLERRNEVSRAAELAKTLPADLSDDPAFKLLESKLAERSGALPEALQALSFDLDAVPDSLKIEIMFERARILDKLARFDEAFSACTLANQTALDRYRRNNPRIDFSAPRLAWLDDEVQPDLDDAQRWRFTVMDDDGLPQDPVFVVGFPRSGTTLLDQVLDAHPKLVTMEEKPVLERVIGRMRQQGQFPGSLAALSRESIRQLRRVYWNGVAGHVKLEGQRLVDKNPLYLVRMPVVLRLFPNAKFVFALRDPRDVSLSCFMQNFQYTNMTLGYWSLDSIARLYLQCMDLWREAFGVLRPAVHVVAYENLVQQLENEVESLIGFLGLPWDPSILDFSTHARSRRWIQTPSYRQVAQPLYRTSRARWRRYETQLGNASSTLQPYIERYGYADDLPGKAGAGAAKLFGSP